MEARNGYHRDDLPLLQQKIREARARQRLARLEAEAQLLEAWGVEPSPGYPTPYLDPFDFQRFGWGVGGFAAGGGINSAGNRTSRQDGADRPFFWSETDLERSRGLARWLATKNMLAVGALNALKNFTVKQGYQYACVAAKGWANDPVAQQLAEQVQRLIDQFSLLNGLPRRERSAFLRSRRDGETLVRFFDQGDGTTFVRFVLPEQLRQPLGSPSNWSYGIETDAQDIETPLRYALDYNGDEDFCYVPADEIAHLKLNVDEEVKRGLSDFYCTSDAFDETSKLLRNMRITAGVQSAVAWYERFMSASSDALSTLGGKRKDLNRPQVQHPFSGRTLDYEHFEPGQVRLINGNREFLPAPLAQNTSQHISIAASSMRALGVRWNLPEFIISGDASNNNFASILIAGSPFVNSVECEQDEYSLFFLRWRWTAVRNAARARLFRVGTRVFSFAEIQQLVEIHATPPSVAISNKGEETERDHRDLAARVVSIQHLREKRGYDNDKIRQELAEEPPVAISGKVTDVDAQGNPVGKGITPPAPPGT